MLQTQAPPPPHGQPPPTMDQQHMNNFNHQQQPAYRQPPGPQRPAFQPTLTPSEVTNKTNTLANTHLKVTPIPNKTNTPQTNPRSIPHRMLKPITDNHRQRQHTTTTNSRVTARPHLVEPHPNRVQGPTLRQVPRPKPHPGRTLMVAPTPIPRLHRLTHRDTRPSRATPRLHPLANHKRPPPLIPTNQVRLHKITGLVIPSLRPFRLHPIIIKVLRLLRLHPPHHNRINLHIHPILSPRILTQDTHPIPHKGIPLQDRPIIMGMPHNLAIHHSLNMGDNHKGTSIQGLQQHKVHHLRKGSMGTITLPSQTHSRKSLFYVPFFRNQLEVLIVFLRFF
ncbi:hypothetical protein TcasGA2_TC031931 [Tribolium castaneum]|nr:hypothetical protein TcasGA2_TC031931 [Tribolium castaneum]